jgi:hypothetical protein
MIDQEIFPRSFSLGIFSVARQAPQCWQGSASAHPGAGGGAHFILSVAILMATSSPNVELSIILINE